ncbi:translation termination factor GTPase eRF3 [Coccidioides immitis]|uniref:Elongation factor 1-alpha n=2 Tax=Coccidioides immitis TaxID=5501 RepID=A0A0J8R908_COCIT|nr:eukaryotic peptide chain release factor GTP-binding subunit [Coccidioides immitis RMSCC 2394]KMU81524.1 eukaryotic peptide chain release factor GTP-binding subunit [Coccidioides immitis RMSCC 3703]TPX25801.1 translation termination factor GTPase eRF3 [Coccidioides immitis]
MSHLDSWEDDPAAQDENLSRQAQQSLNLNPQTSSFRPGATSFQPGASEFQPGQTYQGYGSYQQYGQYQQQGYGGYQQQQPYGQYSQPYGQQGGYNQYYGQKYGGYNAQQQQQQQPQSQAHPAQQQKQWQPTEIAERRKASSPAVNTPAAQKPSSTPTPTPTAAVPKAKILSIGGDIPKSKTSSTTSTTPASTPKPVPEKSSGPAAVQAASKVTAAKAIEKTEKKAEKKAAASGKTSPTPSSGRSSPSRAEIKAANRDADSVAREQAADVDEATLKEIYGEKREHVNLIFIGHVDAGKSTLGGSILYATGMVDERTMEKYKKEAKDAGRETWYLSWALDLTNEERSKGKTVEVGRAFFKTSGDTADGPVTRHYTILDAPGHKSFVPNMIGGASQADVGILVISARKGEYETGFERGGQTREHALLARNAGVKKLIVAVNKMDDPTVEWSKARYEECSTKIGKFLEAMGYKKDDLKFMPISAQRTMGINTPVPKDLAPWYNGPSLLDYLHNMKMPERKLNAPFMMPISAKYKDMGTVIEGRIESGVLKKGSTCVLMPNRDEVTVTALYGETEEEITTATCGDQIRARLRGAEEEDIMPGFVMCSPKRPVHCVSSFEAKIRILDLKSILTAGFNCVMHIHSAIEEVTFAALLHKLEKETGRRSKKPPPFASKGQTIIARLQVIGGAGAVCVERFEDYNQLGRFTLRDQGQTIAIGMITKLITDTPST